MAGWSPTNAIIETEGNLFIEEVMGILVYEYCRVFYPEKIS